MSDNKTRKERVRDAVARALDGHAKVGLVDAAEVARRYGVSRSWVYANAQS